MNTAKGYDLFGETIIKILDKHREWRAKVIGDEPREKLFYNHKNLEILGFKNPTPNTISNNPVKKAHCALIAKIP